MDKVNEFEHGEDRRPYNVSKSFQQLYGPEANFSYRAHTADEILSDVKKLQDMIRDHYEKQCPRLAALDDYMKARNTGIYNDENRRVEEGKADHRAAHNFAKIINVFDVGYNTGIPIKKSSDNEKINEMITEYDKLNDVAVSYTHLDVYKRQGQGNVCQLGTGPGELPASFQGCI